MEDCICAHRAERLERCSGKPVWIQLPLRVWHTERTSGVRRRRVWPAVSRARTDRGRDTRQKHWGWSRGEQGRVSWDTFLTAMMDEGMMPWKSILGWDSLTGPLTTLTVITVPVLTGPLPNKPYDFRGGKAPLNQSPARPVVESKPWRVGRETPAKLHPWHGWSWAVSSRPSHWAHGTPAGSGNRSRWLAKSYTWLTGPISRRSALGSVKPAITATCSTLFFTHISLVQSLLLLFLNLPCLFSTPPPPTPLTHTHTPRTFPTALARGRALRSPPPPPPAPSLLSEYVVVFNVGGGGGGGGVGGSTCGFCERRS